MSGVRRAAKPGGGARHAWEGWFWEKVSFSFVFRRLVAKAPAASTQRSASWQKKRNSTYHIIYIFYICSTYSIYILYYICSIYIYSIGFHKVFGSHWLACKRPRSSSHALQWIWRASLRCLRVMGSVLILCRHQMRKLRRSLMSFNEIQWVFWKSFNWI